jgi:hypothetical protein
VIQSGVEIRLRRCRGIAYEDIQRERERKSHFLPTRFPNSRKLPQPTPNSANYTNVRNFGNFSRLLEKRRRKKSVSISLLTSGAEGDFR